MLSIQLDMQQKEYGREGGNKLINLIEFMKGAITKMFNKNDVIQNIGVKPELSTTMASKMEDWRRMLKGKAQWVEGPVKSLKLESAICQEFANIVLNEMECRVSNEKLDKLIQSVIDDLNENLQEAFAIGAFVIKPLGQDSVEFIAQDKYIPLKFYNKKIVDILFFDKKIYSNYYYTRVERHTLDERGLTIENRAFRSNNEGELGREIPLDVFDDWAKLPQVITYRGVTQMDFGYYRNPIFNKIDGSPCGISVFDDCIDDIERADKQMAGLDWEFESGERAVHVDNIALRSTPEILPGGKQRQVVPKLNERLYKGLNLQAGNNTELFKEYSPEFRDQSILNGFNAYLRRIEFNACLSYGDLSDVQFIDKTATEAKIAKKRKYNRVTAIQKNLKTCLEDLTYALAFYNAMLHRGYELICNFNDSILVDDEVDRDNDRKDLANGTYRPEEYRSKWRGETLEEAEKNLPEQADVLE